MDNAPDLHDIFFDYIKGEIVADNYHAVAQTL
jgi:hypothetical protein